MLVHCHEYKTGGIGDFIRASLSYYSISKRFGFNYYINFDNNPYLKDCFIFAEIPKEITNIKLELCNPPNGGECDFKDIKHIVNKMISGNNCFINSNPIGFESNDNILKIKDEYFSKVLSPTNNILNNIKNIYNKYNLTENNYISVHIRCGDRNMGSETSNDVRINLYDNNIYHKYKQLIDNFINKYSFHNIPIILHSDTQLFKHIFSSIYPNIITLDLKIKHIAENIGNNTSDSYISTITEFYILSKSKAILMPDVYSGFSHIASIIENKPLYTSVADNRLKLLHANNVYKL